MMKRLPIYTMDTALPEGQRWDALPGYLRRAGRTIATRGLADIDQYHAVEAVAKVLRLFTKGRNPYRNEIKGASRVLDISFEHAMATNFLYEITQAAAWGCQLWNENMSPAAGRIKKALVTLRSNIRAFKNGGVACTAGAKYIEGLGMTHVRSMDWPVDGLGRHTIIQHHVNNPAGDFFNISWPGYSGVLSGFKPGKFSATLNQAPMLRPPNLQWPPAQLLRWVFENCRSYTDALNTLRQTPVCVPAFILLTSPTRSAVVEMFQEGNRAHHLKRDEPLVVANDYLNPGRRAEVDMNEDDGDSEQRRDVLLRRMSRINRGNMTNAHRLLQAWPVQHACSMQQMVFSHGLNQMLVVGRENDEPVAETLISEAGIRLFRGT